MNYIVYKSFFKNIATLSAQRASLMRHSVISWGSSDEIGIFDRAFFRSFSHWIAVSIYSGREYVHSQRLATYSKCVILCRPSCPTLVAMI
jgi:hypothetical protein